MKANHVAVLPARAAGLRFARTGRSVSSVESTAGVRGRAGLLAGPVRSRHVRGGCHPPVLRTHIRNRRRSS